MYFEAIAIKDVVSIYLSVDRVHLRDVVNTIMDCCNSMKFGLFCDWMNRRHFASSLKIVNSKQMFNVTHTTLCVCQSIPLN